MKKIVLYLFVAICYSFTFSLFAQTAQSKDIPSLLLGKRWGLRLFIEKDKNLYDTIFRVRDCQNEFIEITANGRFLSTDLEKEGRWTLQDTLLTLRKAGGGKYKKLHISYLTTDSLVMVDREVPTDVFIETYKICDAKDTTFLDTRQIKEIRKSWGLTLGYQQFKKNFIEIGIATGRFEWNNAFYAMGTTLELAPWNNTYGLGVNFWSEKTLLYGVGMVGYTDFSDYIFGFRPILGLSASRFLHQYSWTTHLTYSYTFLFGRKQFEHINQHAITLRAYIPFTKTSKKVRRIVKQNDEY